MGDEEVREADWSCRSCSRLMTCACTETSSAETGSSATMKLRLHRQRPRDADALPLAAARTRAGSARRARAAAPPRRSSSATRVVALAARAHAVDLTAPRPAMSPHGDARVRASCRGPGRRSAPCAAAAAARSFSIVEMFPRRTHACPPWARQPQQRAPRGALAAPRLAHQPSVSPLRQVEADAVHRPHVARLRLKNPCGSGSTSSARAPPERSRRAAHTSSGVRPRRSLSPLGGGSSCAPPDSTAGGRCRAARRPSSLARSRRSGPSPTARCEARAPARAPWLLVARRHCPALPSLRVAWPPAARRLSAVAARLPLAAPVAVKPPPARRTSSRRSGAQPALVPAPGTELEQRRLLSLAELQP